MAPFPFDTLSASKQLREAGMPEGMAEAVVSVFQHAASPPDISDLATKSDIAGMATRADFVDMIRTADIVDMVRKADIADMVRKADIADMVTKQDIADMATRADLSELRLAAKADLLELEVRIMERMRQQGWALLGGTTVLLAISTGIGRLIA